MDGRYYVLKDSRTLCVTRLFEYDKYATSVKSSYMHSQGLYYVGMGGYTEWNEKLEVAHTV